MMHYLIMIYIIYKMDVQREAERKEKLEGIQFPNIFYLYIVVTATFLSRKNPLSFFFAKLSEHTETSNLTGKCIKIAKDYLLSKLFIDAVIISESYR